MKLKQFDIELEESPRIAFFFLEETLKQNYKGAMDDVAFSGMDSACIDQYFVIYFEERYLNNFEDILDFVEWCKESISSSLAKIEIHAGRFTALS